MDAAIDALLPLPYEIRRNPVLSERIVVLARYDHPQLAGGLDAKTYLDLDHVCVVSRRNGISFEDSELQRLNTERKIRFQCQSHATACQIVAKNDMLLTTTDLVAASAVKVLRFAASSARFPSARMSAISTGMPAQTRIPQASGCASRCWRPVGA
ncbi:MAG: LysR substrate-binding domain-containing protein [Bradyrhizobium sp.]